VIEGERSVGGKEAAEYGWEGGRGSEVTVFILCRLILMKSARGKRWNTRCSPILSRGLMEV
jgi:hypothetical protein